jgi:hypothetical protein
MLGMLTPDARIRGGRGRLRSLSSVSMRFLPALVVTAVMAAVTTAAAAPPEIYPLSKVRRGQTGYGFSTFKAGPPERFTFEVVSVVKNFLPKVDIILVKSDDPKLAVSGFWRGMSGSPLYIEDKLVCAFSYGFAFNKVPMGGCTPLQFMKDEGLDVPRRRGPAATTPKKPGKRAAKPAATSMLTTPQTVGTMADWRRLAPHGDVAEAIGTRGSWLTQPALPAIGAAATVDDQVMTASVPMSAAGFSAPAFAEVEKLFAGSNVEPMRAGGTAGGDDVEVPAKLEMGGSISLSMIRGDMSLAATGTVSYIDANKVLAFGHPMFKAGEIYMPVSTAKVHTVVASAQFPFVLASPGKEVGSLIQDRSTMIMADTNLKDPMIPVDIFVTSTSDKATDKGEFHVTILDNKFFTGPLASMAVMNGIDYYLPDRDHVTAKIESRVVVKGLGELAFTDYLYANDGASSVVGGARALRAASALLNNPFGEVELERVEVKVDLRFKADYGDIKEIQLPSQTLAPGKRATIKVVMSTFDGGEVFEEIPVDVPAKLAGSIVQLEVSAGDSARLDAASPVDLDSLMKALKKMLPGNVWAATLSLAEEGVAVDGVIVKDLPASAHDKLRPASRTQRAQAYKPMARTVSAAKRVLNGSASIMVRIADK